ncbi:AraC family transcriptional regulator [Cohnella nanjingensis]|uniref:AraC family transcriptional regulator n=1 Tax=Cohnella nanjingensis TaxID=1387779 RepID=A0A7X0VFM6_9BACL|nr:AraC family transcriptional regulator [Cohnella nanjingensis]MBB6672205.1 AraC family transcriptional regulator [Cohnella nanjingensis]
MSYVESVQRAIDYIEDHLTEELDLSYIAGEAYISVAQLYRVFYALTGHPVKDYIRKRRMSVAAGHLRNSGRSVEDLAWDSGFESYQSFAKVFKKIAGMTPAAYRKADIFYSFEPIRLHEKVVYLEDKEQTEAFPDVKVIRFMPERVYTFLYTASQEQNIENDAFQAAYDKIAELMQNNQNSKVRIFGHNVDPPESGTHRYGYRILLIGSGERLSAGFDEQPFVGGLYAVRKIAASPPETVQDGWNRLLAEWLPKSTFEIGRHQYIEEFIAYNGKLTRMNLYLPVQRKLHPESIEVVELTARRAVFCRGIGTDAQRKAEDQLIRCHEKRLKDRKMSAGRYYMSFNYGFHDSNDNWWENGILENDAEALDPECQLEEKVFGPGLYACCISKPYGLLIGVLDKMHRWIAANDQYRLDEKRQWFAEYHTVEGTDIEKDTVVKIYIPIFHGE